MTFWANDRSTLYHADARDIPLPDESVHMVCTSPPYWGLRNYGLGEWHGGDSECDHAPAERPPFDGYSGIDTPAWRRRNAELADKCRCGAIQSGAGIGAEPTLAEHIENLVQVFREVKRVLRPDGTVWLNYGDAYSHGGHGSRDPVKWPKQSRNDHYVSHSKRGSGMKPKSLMGMPWRLAIALQEDGAASVAEMRAIERASDALIAAYDGFPPDKALGVLERLWGEYAAAKGDSWWLRSAIPWVKNNPMPESVRDRPTSAYEMIFLLAKQPRYYYDSDAVRIPYSEAAIARISQRSFSQQGGGSKDPKTGNRSHRRTLENLRRRMEQGGEQQGANLRNVWMFPTQPRPEAHFATFPDELPRRCILLGTSHAGVCADCGAPWERVTKTPKIPDSLRNRANGKMAYHRRSVGSGQALQDFRDANPPETVGWRPICEHESADAIPATVLDPFVGSGTTVAVAQSLGRRGIGLDLNPEYLEIARRTIEKVTPQMKVDV